MRKTFTKNFHKSRSDEAGKFRAGFTVLYAMLIAALLITIGLSIYNILLKELILSSDATNSQIAFSAADSGFECALYWDTKGNSTTGGESVFPSSSGDGSYSSTQVMCDSQIINGYNNQSRTTWSVVSNANSATTTLAQIDYTSAGQSGACAQVTVAKNVDASGQVTTTVDSNGYNTCVSNDPRAVQRSVSLTY